MTERPGSDARLQEAFRALGDVPGTDVSDDLRERIWLAVSGALPAAERRELVDRMATDPKCAEAWRVAHDLWQASEASVAAATAPPPQRLGEREAGPAVMWWARPWLAAAAVLFLTTIGVVSLLNRPPADEFRASSGYVVASLVPADMTLRRDDFRLRWTPGPEGSRYQVKVTTNDLQVLATAADLTAPEFVVEPAALSGLPAGARVFWQVDVSLPSGEQMTSPTFIAGVE